MKKIHKIFAGSFMMVLVLFPVACAERIDDIHQGISEDNPARYESEAEISTNSIENSAENHSFFGI